MAISVAIMLQLAIIYVPSLQAAFSTVSLSLDKWGITLLTSDALFVVEETRKVLFPRLFTLGKWRPLEEANA